MIDYTVEVIDGRVVFTLTEFSSPSFESYVSEDGFLRIDVVRGVCDGNLGYGELHIYLSPGKLPLTLESPAYEYEQDITDMLERITSNMETLKNGNVLP